MELIIQSIMRIHGDGFQKRVFMYVESLKLVEQFTSQEITVKLVNLFISFQVKKASLSKTFNSKILSSILLSYCEKGLIHCIVMK